ncbi:MAG: acyl-CoA dehydrogenase [Candidatus Thermofonsia Clade 1 bacterium]|jgi:alkylation response protein AidB-like acyl-CoA dehydrogenase|uniref:Acyl-CoA dehydrogenase n=1 Tax=Candidatus Thermofonsia Clade 1 bacterium TaxID=2364210 RepID=A0A2M8PGZ4_9CHLR|nr:MAG: acyl-CoA dehydrogenase [Candidatus Thermofonsia Clade 1 bacterium]
MHFELTQEQRMYQRAVRDFCEAEIKPYAAQIEAQGDLRWEAIRKMPQLGLTGLQVPEKYGGAGLDTICASIAVEELGRVCGSTALSISAHNGLGCAPIVRWGTPEQKDRFLPRLTSGEVLGALALTEPNAGSDLLSAQTSATLQDGHYVINGTKAWITNARYAPVIITLVRTDKAAGSRGFTHLLVETDRPGLTIHPPEKKMGLKGSSTHMISYEGVCVPIENVLGEVGRGFHQTMETLDAGRISIGALSVGIAQGAFEEAVKYAKQRVAFGKPISEHQAIQWMIADAALEIDAARLLVYRAAWLKDQGKPFTKEAAMAKLFASEVAERVCFNAIQIHGSYGYSAEFPVERMYRDQRLMSIGEGTSQIQRLVIARRVLQEMSS